MKITKIELIKAEGILTVWTDTFEEVGFNFKINEITDKEDLKTKINKRVSDELQRRNKEAGLSSKFKLLKEIEGKEI